MKERHYIEAFGEYQKRLSRFCSFEVTELAETGDPERGREDLLARIPAGAFVAALCVEGRQLTSEELAQLMRECGLSGRSRLCFLIGGSLGLSEAVKRRADLRLSMSAMTFPHHLARVMLAEQIYRAVTIIEGMPYHK